MVRGHARRFAGFSERNERFMRLSDALRSSSRAPAAPSYPTSVALPLAASLLTALSMVAASSSKEHV